MSKPAFLDRQKPGTDYGALKSLVTQGRPESRSNSQLSAEERRNLDCFLTYKSVPQSERRQFQTATCKMHRAGFIHLATLRGRPGMPLEYDAMVDRYDEIEDIIVKGDRLWCVFTLRATQVAALYGVPCPPSGRELAFSEMCVVRFEDGKIAEGWFFGDELGICRQLGIEVKITPAEASSS
jgi:predicted ester cyclase